MICCYQTEAKGQICKEIILIFLCVALLLSFTLPQIGDYTIRELIYGVQDTTTVIRGTRIACEIIAVSNPRYVVYTIYGRTHVTMFDVDIRHAATQSCIVLYVCV